jgi:hypothetical protein
VQRVGYESGGRKKARATVGVFAITLLLLFTVLAMVGVLSAIEWIIADLIVALVANMIFRALKKQK